MKLENVIKGLEICYCSTSKCEDCPYYDLPDEQSCNDALGLDALSLLKEQEAHELTKTEWEQWEKDKNREPICMVWYGDTTPIWVLKPENVNEPLYLMGKIKLFDKKPRKEQVKWE